MTKAIQYKVIGVMSGTSLDGLDLAHCIFTKRGDSWSFAINAAETVQYEKKLSDRLSTAMQIRADELKQLDVELGRFIGKSVVEFINSYGFETDFVSSHGHTVFHQPQKGFTLQIGSGWGISEATGLTVINDFRSLDVEKGGNGAPLVPIGDQLLFNDYDYCLNLGGFMNISTDVKGERIARDICSFNVVLNLLSQKKGMSYDKDGMLSSEGKVNTELLNRLNNLEYYQGTGPSSLGMEWLNEVVLPLLDESAEPSDLMRTWIAHSVDQLAKYIEETANPGSVLLSGGGTYNKTFTGLLKERIPNEITIPEKRIIEFKEALIFAFLGVLRLRNEVNTLSSVTGATEDSCGGCIYPAGKNGRDIITIR